MDERQRQNKLALIIFVAACVAITCAIMVSLDAADGKIDGVIDLPAAQDRAARAAAGEGDWQTGKCTAYDPVAIGASGQTASGIMLNNNVPTVAAPVEHRELLGRQVELEYNGTTVVATITDLGEFASYGVAFDFAPGTFRAFGASTAEEWGAHEVRYRYL